MDIFQLWPREFDDKHTENVLKSKENAEKTCSIFRPHLSLYSRYSLTLLLEENKTKETIQTSRKHETQGNENKTQRKPRQKRNVLRGFGLAANRKSQGTQLKRQKKGQPKKPLEKRTNTRNKQRQRQTNSKENHNFRTILNNNFQRFRPGGQQEKQRDTIQT